MKRPGRNPFQRVRVLSLLTMAVQRLVTQDVADHLDLTYDAAHQLLYGILHMGLVEREMVNGIFYWSPTSKGVQYLLENEAVGGAS